MEYPTRSIEEAVEALAGLPGIGRKTALRLAMHLLRAPAGETEALSTALRSMRDNTRFCERCGNLAEAPLCHICQNSRRDTSVICVVADAQDVLAVEKTAQYNGLYHVLGGLISPMDGISPDDLRLEGLFERVQAGGVDELILALSASMEGETTAFYMSKALQTENIRLSSIARGIPLGSELEYADELTIASAIRHRRSYSSGNSAE